MKRKLLKIPALILIIFLLFPVPSRAVEPLTTFLLISFAAHVIVGGVLWYQGVHSSPTTGASVTPDGKLGRGATVQWIDTKDIGSNGLPTAKQRQVTVKADTQKVLDAARSNPSKYPKLSAAAVDPSVAPSVLSVGTVVSIGSSRYKITGATIGPWAHTCASSTPSSPGVYSGGYYYAPYSSGGVSICSSPNSSYVAYVYPAVPTTDPVTTYPSTPASVSSFSQRLANSSGVLSSPAGVFSDYYGDIDEYIKSNPGNVSVVDCVDPSNVSTASNVALPRGATQSDVNTAVAAAGARSAAQSAVDTAQSNYNSNPSPENAQRLADALRELARIVDEHTRLGLIGDGDGDEDDEDFGDISGNGFDASTSYGTLTDDDFSLGNRFQTFFNQMRTTAVFSLPNQFLTGLPSGGSSTMSFNGGRFGNHTFDFATFSSLWTTLKTIILVLFGWFSIRIVTLKGGGG